MPPTKKENRFDPAKLMTMREPLLVRVEKVKGNTRMPIEVPGRDGAAPGTNWTRESILGLENWILTDWTGGGIYHFMVVDEAGVTMEWEGAWDPRTYPEKVPPNQASAAQPPAGPAPVVNVQAPAPAPMVSAPPPPPIYATIPPQAQPLGFGSMGTWPPQTAAMYGVPVPQPQAPAPTPQPQATYYPAPNWYSQFGMGTPLPAATQINPQQDRARIEEKMRDREEIRRIEEELKQKDAQLQQRELERKESEYKAALDRQNQQHQQELALMREELRRLGEGKRSQEADAERQRERDTVNQRFSRLEELIAKSIEANSKPAEDPRLKALEDELRRTKEESQRERDRLEQKQEMERLRQEQRERELRIEASIREVSANKQDPMIAMMQENARIAADNARVQSENLREIARMQSASADRMANMMLTPSAVAALVKDGSAGTDHLLRNVTDVFNSMFGTFKGAIEQLTNLTGGQPDPPAVRLLEEGAKRVSGLAEKYLGLKREQTAHEARTKQAELQATMMQAQAMAAMRAQQPQPVQQVQQAQQARTAGPVRPRAAGPTPPVQQGQGLSGAPSAPTTPASQQPQPKGTDDGVSDPQTGQTVAKVIPIVKSGMTEDQLFGVAWESVKRLRLGVHTFLESLIANPPRLDDKGNPVGLAPVQAVDAILQGVNYLSANNIAVPAFELFAQERFADFIDLLIPNATQPYRDECVQILTHDVDVNAAEGDDGEDEEDGEAEEDEG